jgi:hypothetical protein
MEKMDKHGRNRRRLDRGKNVLIILLAVSALFLMSRTDYFGFIRLAPTWLSSVFGLFQDGSPDADAAEEGEIAGLTTASMPAAMAVTSANGGHFGVKYDGEALNEHFGRFSASLGIALGSSGDPAAVTEREWQKALSGEGVFFDYTEALPLNVLAQWLGSPTMNSEAGLYTARRLCLAKEGAGLTLFFISARDGQYYACKTLSLSSLDAQLKASSPNGAYFAWESADTPAGLDPYILILEEMPTLHTLSVTNPFRDSLTGEELLTVFEMNSFTAIPYTESDGTVVYVEGDSSLRLYPDGTAVFRQSGGEILSAGGFGASDAVDMALYLAKAGVGAHCGAAGLYLSGLHYDPASGGSYTVTFDYAVNGIPVLYGDAHAVSAVIRGGVVTRASMTFQKFTVTDGLESPLPMRQAAAIVSESGGGEPMLAYHEMSGDGIGLGWVFHS